MSQNIISIYLRNEDGVEVHIFLIDLIEYQSHTNNYVDEQNERSLSGN